MTEAEEACPHDRIETAVEDLNIPRENTDEAPRATSPARTLTIQPRR